MKKTFLAAATLLTLGVGSAFAGDGDVYAQPPAPPAHAAYAQQATGQNRLFPAISRPTTSVYSLFSHPGYPQGGEN